MTALNEIKPTLEEIKDKISQNDFKADEEHQFYELKRPQNGMPDIEDFIVTVVSFCNTLGGYLVIETGDLKKTTNWVNEHQWENSEQWRRNSLSRLNDKISMACDLSTNNKNYVVLSINRIESPFEFVNYDKNIFLRVGARKKKIAFENGDAALLKGIMEQRLISNSNRESAAFWEKFYGCCCVLFQKPELMDNTNSDSAANPVFKECCSMSINSQNITELRALRDLSIRLNVTADVKNAFALLISASDAVKAKRNKEVYTGFTLAEMYKNSGAASQSLSLEKTKEWLKHIKEAG